MPVLHSSDEIVQTLKRKGFVFVGQKGSHIKMRKEGRETLTVIIPANKKEIPHGTLRSIARQARLSWKDFE